LGSGKPSVNVEGHATFSTISVVVVVSLVEAESDDVAPRRGMVNICGNRVIAERRKREESDMRRKKVTD
jgi:hypothetical protein